MHVHSTGDYAFSVGTTFGRGFTFPHLASNPLGHTRAPLAVACSGDRDRRYHASGKHPTPYKHTNP